MRRFFILFAFAFFLCAMTATTALGETVTADGIRYELNGGVADIVGIEEGVTEITIYPEFRGLPTEAIYGFDTGTLHTVILGEGVDALEDYEALFQSPLKRVEIPSTLPLPNEDVWRADWLNSLGRVEEIKLPANYTLADLNNLAAKTRILYWDSAYSIMFYNWEYWMYEEDGEEAPQLDPLSFRVLRRIKIDKDNPRLYDIDGVVFERGTDRLVLCPIARSGGYDIPMGTRGIGASAFESCDQLESVAIPRSVATIESSAFKECSALHTINLPPTLQRIEPMAFKNCVSLTSIILPNGITVEESAFDYCTGLRAIYCNGDSMDIHKDAFLKCVRPLALYAKEHSGGYNAAAENELLWAEIGGAPARLPNPNHPHQRPAIVHQPYEADMLPLYEKPDSSSAVLGQYPLGTTVDILDDQGGWAHVALYQAEGYMRLSGLLPQNDNTALERVLQVKCAEGSDQFIIYDGPSLDAPSTRLDTWEAYNVIQRFGIWYVVETQDGPKYSLVRDCLPFGMRLQDFSVRVVASKSPYQRAVLFSEPDEKSAPLGAAYNGVQVKILKWDAEEKDGFEKVQIGETVGYMKDDRMSWIGTVTQYEGY